MAKTTGDPKPKKKPVAAASVTRAVGTTKPGSVSLKAERQPIKKTYTPETANTGHPAYGKESKTAPVPKFVRDAQKKKQDIVYKNDLPYRAGRTKIEDPGAKLTTVQKVPTLEFKFPKGTSSSTGKPPSKTSSGKSKGKLKAMGMTYGTDSPSKGGGTSYKKRVRKGY
jgi:hypothetical protein